MRIAASFRPSPFVVAGGATLAIVGTATFLMATASEERRQIRRFDTWYVEGPACRTWSTLPAASRPPAKAFRIDGATIVRQHGHMACWRIRDHQGRGPGELLVCHMLSPGLVEVRSPAGVSRFDPGAGGSATILADAASVRCVTRIHADLFSPMAVRAYD